MSVGVHQSALSLLAVGIHVSRVFRLGCQLNSNICYSTVQSNLCEYHQTTDCATTLDPVVERAVQTCADLAVFLVSVLLLRKSVIFLL